ncbi:MAG: protein kinase [Acidimicrobiales bacterium]|nr:protein kinase [Acidimicrobiales bacterium]
MVDAIAAQPLTSENDSCPQCGHEVGDAWLVCAWCGQQLAAPAELAEGTRLADGRYQILKVIGRGGFGITYDVGDRRLERRVAMKELFPESAVRHGSMVLTPPAGRPSFKAARERFLREARVLARFTHPGIVRVFEVFEEHGTAYLVMELLEGRTLIDLLRQHGRPFDEADVLDVAGRVAAALRPVHAAGVLHRDVNPSNVMMTHHGRVVVIDFGLARDYDQDHTAGMTRVVTPGYAPLEQYQGEGRFGPSTDVYGLAATLYRLATGKVPVSALDRSTGAALTPPHRINPEISKPVSDALMDGLELEPGHRPQDIDAFLSRLGVGRLPDGPRARLLDTVPVPPRDAPSGSTAVAAQFAAGGSVDTSVGRSATEHRRRPQPTSTPDRLDASVDGDAAGTGDARRFDHTVIDPAFAVPAVADHPGTDTDTDPDSERSDRTVVDPAYARAEVPDATRAAAPGVPAHAPEGHSGDTVHVPRSAVHIPVGAAPPPGSSPEDPVDLARPGAAAPDARLALALGPHRPGRRKLTVPLAVAATALGAAAPVLVTALVVLVVLPWLATYGDSVAHRLRVQHGVAGGWAERRLGPGTLAPARFTRNVMVCLLRASPVVGVGAVALAGWYGLESIDPPRALLHLALRVIGATVVGIIVVTSREGSHRFRTGLAIDELVARLVPGGRTNERVVAIWLLAAALAAGALWLTPSTFPLP